MRLTCGFDPELGYWIASPTVTGDLPVLLNDDEADCLSALLEMFAPLPVSPCHHVAV